MKLIRVVFASLVLIGAASAKAQRTVRYVNDMEYVLGDVKQGFIHDRIKTEAQVENLLKGFKELGVNGIRIPIFAANLVPDKVALDYFFLRAKEEGFKIFANPVLTDGGIRIASNMLFGETESPADDPAKTQALIDRIKEFAQEYPCDWICPFNEDRSPGKMWTAAQYNEIFLALHQNLNGAELIGPCQWGLQAGIDTFEHSEVMQYVSVATTHNLGFNHGLWSAFINKAKNLDLPVWDSEVNNNAKNGRIARIEAAINNQVDGLVLYNSWNAIDLDDGSLKNANLYVREYVIDSIELPGELRIEKKDGQLELSWISSDVRLQQANTPSGPWADVENAASPHLVSPDSDKMFFRLFGELQRATRPATSTVTLLHNASNAYLAYDEATEQFSLSSTPGTNAQWRKVAEDAQWFYLEHAESGRRLGSEDDVNLVMENGSKPGKGYHWFILEEDGSDWTRLIQRATEGRLHIQANEANFRIGPSSWTGNNTRWQVNLLP